MGAVILGRVVARRRAQACGWRRAASLGLALALALALGACARDVPPPPPPPPPPAGEPPPTTAPPPAEPPQTAPPEELPQTAPPDELPQTAPPEEPPQTVPPPPAPPPRPPRDGQPQTTGRPPTAEPPPAAALPAFPWPPPRYSAFAAIAREWVAPGSNATLGTAADRLEQAFDRARYGERSYYWIPGGFALVSRIEQIGPDATPVAPPARWSVQTPQAREGLLDFIRALFNAPPGYYRVIVFAVTDQDFAAGERAPTSSEAQGWITSGLVRLPDSVASLGYSDRHYTTALIYEFERRADESEARVRTPSGSPGRVHLEKAGLWQALGGE